MQARGGRPSIDIYSAAGFHELRIPVGPLVPVRQSAALLLHCCVQTKLAADGTVALFCCARLPCPLQWEGARIVHLGWSDQELLVVVTENASVHLWDVRGQKSTFVREFSMGQVRVCHASCVQVRSFGGGGPLRGISSAWWCLGLAWFHKSGHQSEAL